MAAHGDLPRQTAAHAVDEGLTVGAAHRPEVVVTESRDLAGEHFRRTTPALLAASGGPEAIGIGRVPGRDMDAVRHVSDRDLALGPPWKQRLKDAAAHRLMLAADANAARAAAHRQVSCVEWLGGIV